MTKLAVALGVIALQFYTLWYFRSDVVVPERKSFSEFPRDLDGWHCREPEEFPEEILESLRATDYFSCLYVRESAAGGSATADEDVRVVASDGDAQPDAVHLYIGYHAQQARSGGESSGMAAIHPPEHCLPGSGWDIVDARVLPLAVDGRQGEAKRFVIAKGKQRNLVYFWYQTQGRTIAHSHEKILYTFVDRALSGRTDGALVRMTVPIKDDVEAADRAIADLASAVGPRLDAFVPD